METYEKEDKCGICIGTNMTYLEVVALALKDIKATQHHPTEV
jgi:hypothetical protein